MAGRNRACGASTPWQIIRFASGRGVIAASFSNSSSGSNTSSRVPSCHGIFELHHDAAVGPELQALLRQGRAQHIAAQALQRRAIAGRYPDIGVQVEAVEVGLTGSPGRRRLDVRPPLTG